MMNVPYVQNKKGYTDLFSALLEKDIVTLTGPIDERQAELIVSALLYLDSKPTDTPVHFYISSGGGECVSGNAIHDTMRQMRRSVYTYCIGQCCSMASILFAAGDKRFMLPHARIMLHQASTGFQGRAEDLRIQAEVMKRTNKELMILLAKYTKKTVDEIENDVLRGDHWLFGQEAIDYKIADVLMEEPESRKEIE